VLIADPVGALADAAFGAGGSPSATTAWLGVLAYTVQIYFDFSGYAVSGWMALRRRRVTTAA
jgi:alginate O-acetyltransferase complex protein AlgI